MPTTTTCGNWLGRCYGWLWRLPLSHWFIAPRGPIRQSPCKEIRSVHIIWPLLRPEAIENQMMGDLTHEMSMIQTCVFGGFLKLVGPNNLGYHNFRKHPFGYVKGKACISQTMVFWRCVCWMFHPYTWFHVTLGEDLTPIWRLCHMFCCFWWQQKMSN